MKRILIALLALACCGAVWANGASIGPPGLSGIGPPAQVVTVAKSGARFTTICGATCGTSTAVCAAGSALASFSDSSITKPYIVKVGPGIYDECVAIDNRTDIALIGSGVYATIIRPSVTSASDVLGGVIRIANATGTTASTARIEIADLTVWDDAYTTPSNPAIFVGARDPNTASDAAWMDVDIHDVRAIGNSEAVRFFGSRLTTDTNSPRGSVRNSQLIAGAMGINLAGAIKFTGQDLDILARTNWCETATTTFLSSQTGVVVSGGVSFFAIDAADDFGANDGYVGRKVVLTDTDGGGAGVCGATNALDGDQYWIIDYTTADDTITVTPDTDEAVTTGCTYTIAAVANFSNAPCTDKDWTVIRAGDPNGIYTGPAGIVIKAGASQMTAMPDDNYINIKNARVKIEANDFGPGQGGNCAFNNGVGQSAGFIQCNSSTQDVALEDVDVVMDINVDLDDAANLTPDVACYNIATETEGLAVAKNVRCTINNTGDADTTTSAFVSGLSTTVLRVLGAFVDINNTGGGVGATKTDLLNTAGTLAVGNIVSDATVATSGTITFLNGGTYDAITGTATIDYGALAVSTCADVDAAAAAATITTTGAATGDVVTLGVPAAAAVAGSLFNGWVSAADTVTVRHCCVIVAGCNPASGSFRATVRKP